MDINFKKLKPVLNNLNPLTLLNSPKFTHGNKIIIGLGISVLAIVATVFLFSKSPNSPKLSRQILGQWDYTGEIGNVGISTRFKKSAQGGEINIRRGKSELEFLIPIEKAEISRKENKIIYSTPDKSIQAEYELIENGVKEDIVLNKQPENNTFLSGMNLKNLVLKLTEGGIPVFYSPEGEYQFHFEEPFAFDANGKRTNAVHYVIHPATGHPEAEISIDNSPSTIKPLLIPKPHPNSPKTKDYVIEVVVDKNWLFSENRVYPITIDPTVVHDAQSDFSGHLNRIQDIGTGETTPELVSYYQEIAPDIHTVGLWHMNNDWTDSSGNDNDGTAYGNATFTTNAKLGSHAGTFDGNGDYVSVPDNSILDFSSSFSISAWIYSNGTQKDFAGIITKDQTGNFGNYGLFYDVGGTIVRFGFYGTDTVQSEVDTQSAIPTGEWVHLAGTFNDANNSLAIYQNGVLKEVNNTITNTPSTNSNPLILGSRNAGLTTYEFNGLIDEVAIYNRALTPEEIKAHAQRRPYAVYTSQVIDLTNVSSWNDLSWTESGVATGDGETPYDDTGLVAQWNFNETSGTTAANNAGAGSCGGTPSNCNGTLTNFSDTTGQDVVPGSGWTADNGRWPRSSPAALMFDGSNDIVNFGSDSSLSLTETLTIALWIKRPDKSTFERFLSHSSDENSYAFEVGVDWAKPDHWRIRLNSDGVSFLQPMNAEANEWIYVVFTYNKNLPSNNIKIFENGVLLGTHNYSLTLSNHGELKTNRQGKADGFLKSIIDSVQIYSRTLTADEILANYQAGNIEFQTRVGDTSVPDNTWEEWRPTTSETQILSMDDDVKNWTLAGTGNSPGLPMQLVDVNPTAPSGPTGCANYKPVLINNLQNDTDLSNYQIELLVEHSSGMSSDFTDLRFTNDGGTDLDYWLEDYTADTKATVWIKVDSISGNSSKLIYMWYNGCTGGNTSNGENTFVFFDDFEDGNINKWTNYSSGEVELYSGGAKGSNYSILKTSNNDPHGGYATFSPTLNSYELIFWGNRINNNGGAQNRWGVEDSNFDGYGPQLSAPAGTGDMCIETRSSGSGGSCNVVSETGVSKNMDTWYKHKFRKYNDYFVFDLYDSSGNLMQTVSGSDSTHTGPFDRILIHGGYEFLSDEFRLRKYTSPDPTANVITEFTQPYTEGSGAMKVSVGAPQADANTVGLWHLDETNGDLAGDDVFDSSGNGNHGEFNGTDIASSVVNGVFGKAREFNGTDDYISIPYGNDIDPSVSPHTFSFWTKPNSNSLSSNKIVFSSGAGTNQRMYIGYSSFSNYEWSIGIQDSVWDNTAEGITATANWTHLALVMDGTNATLYVNGKKTTQKSYTSYSFSQNFEIGSHPGSPGTYNFNGLIDEVRISDSARSAEEIAEKYRMGRDHRLSRTISPTDLSANTKLPFWIAADRTGTWLEATVGNSAYANYEPDANTVGLWHLEEDSNYCTSSQNGCVKDSSGNGNHGTPSSAPYTVQGKIGKGWQFDGTDDYIDLGSSNNITGDNLQTITVEAWVKTNSSERSYPVSIKRLSEHSTLISLDINSDSSGNQSAGHLGFVTRNFDNSSFSWLTHNGNYNDGNWHHLVAVVNGSTRTLYINGVKRATDEEGMQNVSGNSAPATIGAFGPSLFLNGSIDAVRISDVARTPEEIRQAYEIGRRTHPITIDFGTSPASADITGTSESNAKSDTTLVIADDGMINNIYQDDKIIVRENYGGTEYIVQSTVQNVNTGTRTITVDSDWTGTIPNPGTGICGGSNTHCFTSNASVFKWQREWWDITEPLSGDINSATNLTFRITDGSEGRTFWLDDFKRSGSYMTDSSGSTISSSTGNQYFQYRAIFSSSDANVSPSLTSVTLDYETCYTQGEVCTLNSECCSGHCVDGYCCNTACTGECEACDITGSEGTCTVKPEGESAECSTCEYCDGINTTCQYVPSNTDPYDDCGLCQACNGSGACTNASAGTDPKNECSVSSWACNGSCQRARDSGTCDGAGTCGTNDETENCSAGTACSGGVCDSGYYCNTDWANSSCQGAGCYNDGGSTYICQAQCDGYNTCNYATNCSYEKTGYCSLEKDKNNNQIIINWTDDSETETGYEIERNVNSAGFSSLTTKPADSTSHTDTDVSAGNTYRYRVRSTFTGGLYGSWCTTAILDLQTGDFSIEGLNLEGIDLD